VKRGYDYRPSLFFVLAYAATWIPWFLGVYVGSQPGFEPYAALFNFIGLLGPVGTALFLVLTSGSAALRSDFKHRLFNLRRIRPVYALVAVLMPLTVICSSIFCRCGSGSQAINSGFPAAPTYSL
jgi:hypothetical protein